ncbi:MAG: phage/plasmid primase, P4 family [Anaerolineae bacterium]
MRNLLPTDESLYPDDLALNDSRLRELDQRPYTDAGQGEAFADLWADVLRYVPGIGWMIWTGNRWQLDDKEAVVQYAIMAARARQEAVLARHIPQGEEHQQNALQRNKERDAKWARSAESTRGINATLQMARTVPHLIEDHGNFDADPMLLGVSNGVVDLRTGHLRPSTQADLISKTCGIPFFPDAQAPLWEQFLQEIFNGDEHLVAYIQRAVGYSFTSSTQEQCFFLCYGTGANGKSTFLNMLKAVGGDYVTNTPFSTFEHRQQSSTGQEIVELRGRRIVLSNETNEGTRLNEARIKAITGGDLITGRYLYARQSITFQPTFHLWLAANHKPAISGGDEGIWRRVRLIPFTRTFRGHQQDKLLDSKLRNELPGILAWAVRGALAWQQQGLNEPQSVQDATQSYRDESDIIGQFLSERTISGPELQAPSGQLYSIYERWTTENGLFTLSSVKFARDLEERGYIKKRNARVRFWCGLGILDD